jgi:hypothetical protein
MDPQRKKKKKSLFKEKNNWQIKGKKKVEC